MPAGRNFSVANLRTGAEGIRGSFEEFCCQLFGRAPETPVKGRFRRIRGAGGDGGVEATWTSPNGKVWGLQAKVFQKLGASEKAQLTESIAQAAANYPTLERYTICLPFNLTGKTGAKAGKPRQGQHETLAKWIGEWQAKLGQGGHTVEIDVWDETKLLGRLAQADASGGLSRYWFNEEVLSADWFEQHLRESKAQAGPRYSPELTVATPLDDALQAFGRSESWIKSIQSLRNRFAEKLDWWRRTATGGINSRSVCPPELLEEAKAVLIAAEPIEENLALVADNPQLLSSSPFRDAVRSCANRGSVLEPRLRDSLLEKHGPAADTPGFRQFHAEYQVDFPMAALDQLRELLAILREVEPLASQPPGLLPAATAMLLRGEAGIGKTHGIVDAAVTRNRQGLRSVVLFGEDVTGPEPWASIAAKLGLGSAAGRDSTLDALNAAGEATGFPLVIFIDALNETQPDRRKWQAWLPPMLEQIKLRSFLKLCVSCRDTYLREVMPAVPELATIVHNGFLGREYEAQFAFFQHYNLGLPAEPLLQSEFSNPLFLRLVCEALQASGRQAVPAGREGIRAIINLLLRAKNERAAAVCDYDHRENLVAAAMLRLAAAMAAAGRSQLTLSEAKMLVDQSTAAQSKSLFGVLEGESLIAIVEQPAPFLGGDPEYFVRFTFERVSDHLIAEHLLSTAGVPDQMFRADGPLHSLADSDAAASANAGLLEALSIQLPETHQVELVDVVRGVDRALLRGPFLAGLQWRDPAFISDRTLQLVKQALGSADAVHKAFEAILAVAARPRHPLNALFLDGLLRPLSMLARDPVWADMLETSYSGWSKVVIPHSGVHRLIDTARRGQLKALPDEVGTLWARALAWFCAAPDRRIRDRATMAMVSIFHARPATILPLIRTFAESDDEYIAERVVLAAYGALLLRQAKPHLQDAASELYSRYFANRRPPLNASLRDHARLIIELAVELGVPPPNLEPRYRPPYPSPWPIAIPSDQEINAFAEDHDRFPQMQLVQKIGLATGTDFARYVVEPRVVTAFDVEKVGLDRLGLFRWFLKAAVDLGYPGPRDQCALFDRNLLAEFGPGRGKPGWAERLGKKYYWILLRQLVGQVADHVERKSWSGTASAPSNNLQGFDLRDIDPTDLRMFSHEVPEDDSWLAPCPYVFAGPDSVDDDGAWVAKRDLPDLAGALILTDPDGIQWQVLDQPAAWRGRRIDRRVRSYRYVSRSVHAVTCRGTDATRVKKAFANGKLEFFEHGPRDYRGYLGEYPRRWPYRPHVSDRPTFAVESAGIAFDNVEIVQLRGNEWERDYSFAGGTPSLLMPSPDLIAAGDLQWDGRGGWVDSQEVIQVIDPWWWSDKGPGLIIRLEYLDGILEQTGKVLVVLGFQTKFVAASNGGSGRLTERTLFLRSKSRTKRIRRKVNSD